MDINELVETKVILERMIKEEENSPEYVKFLTDKYNLVVEMINIYTNSDIDYRIMHLEKIYIETMVNISKDEIDKMDEISYSECYNEVFPRNWYTINASTKELVLTSAILDQDVISYDYLESEDRDATL